MTDLSRKSCLVLDNGLFVDLAEVLARKFGKVYYATSWRGPFPRSRDLMVGDGFETFERVKFEGRLLDRVDCIVCPDVHLGDYQAFFRRQGIPVWGPGEGERLEIDRVWSKEQIAKAGLPVGKYEVVTALDQLRRFLKDNPRVFVKSQFRGDFETFHSDSGEFAEWEEWLDVREAELGPVGKRVAQFLCEWPIGDEHTIETGYDGFTVRGRFPSVAMEAIEIKDRGMVGAFKPYSQLSPAVRHVNARLAPFYAQSQYAGFLSTEIRVTPGPKPIEQRSYLIDPCCRCGSPSHELLIENFANMAEIVWGGAHGELVEPEPLARFGVIVVMNSTWAERHWQNVRIPEEIRQWVKLKNHCRLLGRDTVVPQYYELKQIGGVIGLGNTVAEAVEHARDNADQVKGIELNCKLDSISSAIEAMEEARGIGLHFAPEKALQEAEEVLEQ